MFHLTFDLELYDPVKSLKKKAKDKFISEQEEILKKLFSLFNKNKIKVSCFVTNEFVDNFYEFFHEYIVGIHEIGCHTANHLFYNKRNMEEFVQNITKNKIYLEKETGLNCYGFRAPGGVIPNNLIHILKQLEFKYDSSVVPGFMPGRFNNSRAPKEPYFPDFNNVFLPSKTNKQIIEFPLLTSRIIKLSMNGFFFSYYNKFIDLDKYNQKYGAVYLHPYDFKRFGLCDKSYIWDKMKFTKSNWEFLEIYVCMNKHIDATLIRLMERIKNNMHFDDLY